ncbi:MAG: AAA-like domain-containing protein [Bacteroidales bacterium]|nr:AAA-like domain-containing protein [Bacteroidales bacterium]
MSKEFNITSACNPYKNYMVDISNKFNQVKKMIDDARYFVINRARQFGKTTMLYTINQRLGEDYLVLRISFESMDDKSWQDSEAFCKSFCQKIEKVLLSKSTCDEYINYWHNVKENLASIEDLSLCINRFCLKCPQKVILIIDEVDQASNNDLFIKFLRMLRDLYNERIAENNYQLTFYSVILAGVYDIKNLKLKIRPEDQHKVNSPWNIASEFNVDMSFNPEEISTMLIEYENDVHTNMNISEISNEIYKYTSGYPVLVSMICKEIDENFGKVWTIENIVNVVKYLINKDSDQFILIDDLLKNIEIYPDLKKIIRAILLENIQFDYTVNNTTLKLAKIFSFIKKSKSGKIEIHNLIFQQVLYNYFITENIIANLIREPNKNTYIHNGILDMPLIITRFKDLMYQEYRQRDNQFIEKQCRLLFLCFLKPIINGTGFYYVEPETRDNSKMDLVVTYGGQEFVIELKVWHGDKYETDGKEQLAEYLNTRNLKEGYLVSFSFLKEKDVSKAEWITEGDKKIFEAII